MSAIEHLLAACVLNIVWQLPLLCLVCFTLARAWRNMPARLVHQLWFLCTALAAVLPMAAVLGLFPTGGVERPPSLPVTAPSYTWRALLVAFSLACLIRLCKLVQAVRYVRELSRRALPVVTGDAQPPGIIQRATARGVSVRLLPVNSERFGPLLVGVRRATILIPRPLIDPANGQVLEAAVAHELAHIERKDMLLLVLSELMLVPLAFHPLAGLLRRRLADSREMACDEHVVQRGMDRFEYARSLLGLARNAIETAAPISALGIGDPGNLESRIRALAAAAPGAPRTLGWLPRTAAVLALASCCLLLAGGGRSVYVRLSPLPIMPALFRLSPPPPPPPPRAAARNPR